MSILPGLKVAPAHRETLYSYLARLAAAWHSETSELAYDMGAPFKKLLEQDDAAIQAFADWAGLHPEALAELLSWTGIPIGNVRMRFRGETYVSRALRNPVMRGCPICLKEDAANATGPASYAMVMRGHWQLREAKLCVKHAHPLVRLWEASAPSKRFDFSARLKEIEPDILSGALDRPRRKPTSYDLWLDRRLEDGSDDTWLKDHPVFVITTFCRLLGEPLLNDQNSARVRASTTIHGAAFDVVVCWMSLRTDPALSSRFDPPVSMSVGS